MTELTSQLEHIGEERDRLEKENEEMSKSHLEKLTEIGQEKESEVKNVLDEKEQIKTISEIIPSLVSNTINNNDDDTQEIDQTLSLFLILKLMKII